MTDTLPRIYDGAPDAPVERLLEVARLRIAAEGAGIMALAREGSELIVRFEKKIQATLARIWGEDVGLAVNCRKESGIAGGI